MEVDPQPGLRANSPRLIKYDALILRKKGGRGEEKEGADSYVYADMYFKASISPTLRRFVMGRVYIALLSIHNGFSTTPVDTRGKGQQ